MCANVMVLFRIVPIQQQPVQPPVELPLREPQEGIEDRRDRQRDVHASRKRIIPTIGLLPARQRDDLPRKRLSDRRECRGMQVPKILQMRPSKLVELGWQMGGNKQMPKD